MALNKLKDKLANLAGNETLGSAEIKQPTKEKRAPKQTKPKELPKRAKLKPKPKVEKAVKPSAERSKVPQKPKRAATAESAREQDKLNIVSSNTTERKSSDINIIEGAIPGYKDVLDILGIKEEIKLDVDFKSDELDYIEFTQTTPFGFDFDEVTDFISRTKYTLHKMESALAKRDREIVIIASEVKKVEQRMIEANQEEQMARMMGDMTPEEVLIEENMELKVELNNLKRELKGVSSDSGSIEELNKELEILRAENHALRLNQAPPEDDKLGLPNMDSGLGLPSMDMPNIDKGLPSTEEPKVYKGLPKISGEAYFDSQSLLDDLMNNDNKPDKGYGGGYDE